VARARARARGRHMVRINRPTVFRPSLALVVRVYTVAL
jgi:hypothetical protein